MRTSTRDSICRRSSTDTTRSSPRLSRRLAAANESGPVRPRSRISIPASSQRTPRNLGDLPVCAASAARALLGSWAFEGLGWFALRETSMRVALEGGLLIALLMLGLMPYVVLGSWFVSHTLFWFFLYGGYEKLGSLSGRTTDIRTL